MAWYSGIVVEISNEEVRKFNILYDDGEQESLQLDSEKLILINNNVKGVSGSIFDFKYSELNEELDISFIFNHEAKRDLQLVSEICNLKKTDF